MVKRWKHSRLRFYFVNVRWNYQFWLHAKPVYKEHKYTVDEGLDLNQTLSDAVMKVQVKKTNKVQRRFVGLLYKNQIYQDNPGIQGEDSETWEAWIRKGLVKV
jgi:hypothetical protein